MIASFKVRPLVVVLLCAVIFLVAQNIINLSLVGTPTTNDQETSSFNDQTKLPDEDGKSKAVQIVLWVPPKAPPTKSRLNQMENFIHSMNNVRCKRKCHFSMSNNGGSVQEADAVTFFMFTEGYKPSELPKFRLPEQLWVAYLMEPPCFLHFKNPLKNKFNWTFSYRSDSDVVNPYGQTYPLLRTENNPKPLMVGNATLKTWISGKSKLAAAVISRCKTNSNRELLIQRMNSTGIGEVDVFGKCGNKPATCNRFKSKCTDFWEDLAGEYMFYLAFENSLCTEYITEKFWRSLHLGIVPVVYGEGDYLEKAPPGSFINVKDYKSVADLMKFLKMLSTDKAKYQKYFDWRRDYSIVFDEWHWCNLCEAVHRHRSRESPPAKLNGSLTDWWRHNPGSKTLACKPRPVKFK